LKELTERVSRGSIGMDLSVQLAEDTDVVDDVTIHWPEQRPIVPFGKLALKNIVAEQAGEEKQIIFDPIPRLEGIEPWGDPLLELRAAIYLLSGGRRRQAPQS
jgi:catalase